MVRENRYLVIKYSDTQRCLTATENKILHSIADKVCNSRYIDGKPQLKCVVVEDDWPEYEKVWDMIEERVGGNNDQGC